MGTAAHLNELFVLSGLLEAAPYGRLDVAASEGRELPEDARDLDAVVKEEPQLALRRASVLVGDQSKHVCKEFD